MFLRQVFLIFVYPIALFSALDRRIISYSESARFVRLGVISASWPHHVNQTLAISVSRRLFCYGATSQAEGNQVQRMFLRDQFPLGGRAHAGFFISYFRWVD